MRVKMIYHSARKITPFLLLKGVGAATLDLSGCTLSKSPIEHKNLGNFLVSSNEYVL
jgi:hypothetical protein